MEVSSAKIFSFLVCKYKQNTFDLALKYSLSSTDISLCGFKNQEQLDDLAGVEEEVALKEKIAIFKAEEEEHYHTGLDNEAELTKGYSALTGLIKAGSKAAIEIAKRF
mgnify:CR=1 FL=1